MLREQVVSPDVLFAQSRFARSMKSFRLRIENKSFSTSSTGEPRESSQVQDFFVIDLMMSLTKINRRKRCVNIPRSKKGAH